jgi:LytR cell envelope-related transcriptional attenuator
VDLPAPSLPSFNEPTSGWRRAAIIVGVVAAVELVALVVVALAFIAKPFAGSPDSHAKAAAPASATETAKDDAKPAAPAAGETGGAEPSSGAPAAAVRSRSNTHVLVLNGNGMTGAAGQLAAVVRALRYPVAGVGDALRRDFPRTIVMYRGGLLAEGERLAKDLGLGRARAMPLDGMRPTDLHGAQLVVIVGNAS